MIGRIMPKSSVLGLVVLPSLELLFELFGYVDPAKHFSHLLVAEFHV